MKLAVSLLSVVGSLVLISAPALARDSAHLVCTGYMQASPSPDNYGFAVQFDESRADDGVSRRETLSSVWQGALFQGTRINKKDDFGANGTVTLANTAHPKQVFFKGQYSVVEDSKSGSYSLKLKGVMDIQPSGPSDKSTISTTLTCVDISN